MDALRKAEEAKRQAAQKQKEDKQQEAPVSVSESSAVENLQDLEELLEFDRENSSAVAMPETSEPIAEGIPDVDVPFDFEIDEHFKIDDTQPSTAHQEQVSDLLDAEGIDYLNPEELSRFSAASRASSDVTEEDESQAADDAEIEIPESPNSEPDFDSASIDDVVPQTPSAGLTLEVRAPDIERPSIIGADLEIPEEPEIEPTPSPKSEVQEEEPLEVIRAQRNDDAPNETVQASTEPLAALSSVKLASPKFTEESRKRESARAVFNAKNKGKDSGARKKLIAAAALIALFPLAGGGYLLMDSMGMLSSGNQYNIPAGYDASNRPSFDPLEPEIVEETQLPDVSTEPAIAEAVIDVVEPELISDPEESPVLQSEQASIAIAESGPVVTPIESTTDEVVAESVAIEEAVETALSDVATQAPVQAETITQVADQAPAAINVTRTDNAQRIDPQLVQAYASYRSDDFIGARARYQQVLRDKPNNRDAMLGLAAVAMRLGDATGARETYVRMLELDPRDVHARVGLLETMPASDPVMLESELRALFAAHPEVPHLPFALGNHYAQQRRWSDAQQSYYDALLAAKAGDSGPVSPDYAFNLAVSLERLNQIRPAYTFYREALEQSEFVTPGFDIRVLRDRLDALERVLP